MCGDCFNEPDRLWAAGDVCRHGAIGELFRDAYGDHDVFGWIDHFGNGDVVQRVRPIHRVWACGGGASDQRELQWRREFPACFVLASDGECLEGKHDDRSCFGAKSIFVWPGGAADGNCAAPVWRNGDRQRDVPGWLDVPGDGPAEWEHDGFIGVELCRGNSFHYGQLCGRQQRERQRFDRRHANGKSNAHERDCHFERKSLDLRAKCDLRGSRTSRIWNSATEHYFLYDGTTLLGTVNTATSAPQITIFYLTGGTHSITAQYAGNSNFASSTSAALKQTVNPASTTTTVSSNLNPSSFGQPVTLTAAVDSTYHVNSNGGAVTFYDHGLAIGSSVIAGNGVNLTISSLGTGAHSITANYVGDSNLAASTSAVFTQTVSQASVSPTVALSSYAIAYGQTLTMTSNVKPAYGRRISIYLAIVMSLLLLFLHLPDCQFQRQFITLDRRISLSHAS